MFSGGAGAINLFPETCAGRPVPVPLPYLPVEPLPPPPRLAFFPLGPKVMGQIHGIMDGQTAGVRYRRIWIWRGGDISHIRTFTCSM